MRIFAANINFINNFKTLQQMKTKIKNLLGAAIMMVLPLSFTSCDDILGSWERPVADVYTSTTFKVFNPHTNRYEKMDLSIYNFTKLNPSNVAGLLSSGLSAGKYIVEGNVNYNGDVNVGGDGKLELYIQDNASLTITGGLNAGDIEGIIIAGQKDGSGKLTITNDGDGITAKNLTVDGGNLTVEGGGHGVKLGNEGTLTVNGGDHTIKGNGTTGSAINGNLVFNNGCLVANGSTAPVISGEWTLAKGTQLRDLTTGETESADGGGYTGSFLSRFFMEIERILKDRF